MASISMDFNPESSLEEILKLNHVKLESVVFTINSHPEEQRPESKDKV